MLAYAAFELVFGPDFSRDARYPWAQSILQNRALAPVDKMQLLREAGIFHLASEEEAAEQAEQQRIYAEEEEREGEREADAS